MTPTSQKYAMASQSPIIVQKYGGSSVGTPDKLNKVADRIAARVAQGKRLVVVVSAMGDTTDDLIELAEKVSADSTKKYPRELDVLLSAGERISMALLSMALADRGVDAISFTGSQAGIITDESHTRARIIDIKPIRVVESLKADKVVIVAGFQGVSREKEITTLGRGGSDTTAVALACALKAEACEVYTDVPGIYSADPRAVPEAIRYGELSLENMFELAVAGAQVMHPRSIELARAAAMPLYVGMAHPPQTSALTEFNSKEFGTMLVPENKIQGLELPKVLAVTKREGLVQMWLTSQKSAEALEQLERDSVLTHDLKWNESGELSVILDPKESAKFIEAFASTATQTSPLTSVTVVGTQLQQNAKVPSEMIKIVKSLKIPVVGLTCHPQSITVWVKGEYGTDLVRRFHEKFIRRD